MLSLKKAKLVTIEKASGSYMQIIEITDAGRRVIADDDARRHRLSIYDGGYPLHRTRLITIG